MNVRGIWKNRLSALLIVTAMIFAASGCTIQGEEAQDPAPDAVHQTEDDGTAIYDDDPIAEEPQLDINKLNGSSEDSDG